MARLSNSHPEALTPTPGRRRRFLRGATWFAAAAVAFTAFTLFGWRYGYGSLPDWPGAGDPLDAIAFAGEAPKTNLWHWVRRLSRDNPLVLQGRAPRVQPTPILRLPTGQGPAWERRLAASHFELPTEHAASWLDERPEVAECLVAALDSPDRRAPLNLTRDDVVSFKLLAVTPRWLAEAAITAGEHVTALRHLAAAWRFQAAALPAIEFPELFDERGDEELNEELARPFRRCALAAPALSPAEAAAILADLDAALAAAATPDRAYARLVARSLAMTQTLRRPDWRRVRRSFQVAALLVSQDFGHLTLDVLQRLLGRRQGGTPNYHGALHLLRPLGELIAAVQVAVARTNDFERLHEATWRQNAAALRRVHDAPSEATLEWAPRQRPWWRHAFDRPGVWRSTAFLPDPEAVLRSDRTWRLYLESCRLTLALRVFRDRRGRWPDRLEELVPDILPAVPRDPFCGQPFRYERAGDGWRFWSVRPHASAARTAEAEPGPQRVFTHSEGEPLAAGSPNASD